jgi:hypothetical protein
MDLTLGLALTASAKPACLLGVEALAGANERVTGGNPPFSGRPPEHNPLAGPRNRFVAALNWLRNALRSVY